MIRSQIHFQFNVAAQENKVYALRGNRGMDETRGVLILEMYCMMATE